MSDNAVIERVTRMVAPLVAQMHLDLYDIEFRGGTLRITIDTPPGTEGGVDLEMISLVTRMISRDFDHDDPVPGKYNLEVTSPGLERTLRTALHYHREVGKTVALRLRDPLDGERRMQGVLVAATDTDITIRLDDAERSERRIPHTQIDRARTVFIWGPAPKPGKAPAGTRSAGAKTASKTGPKSGSRLAGSSAGPAAGPEQTASAAATSSPAEASPTQEAP